MIIPEQGWQMSTALGSDQRDALVSFWLAAPMDQLEPLWNGGFGALTQQMVRQLTAQTVLTEAQVALRQSLNQRIGDLGLSQPLSHQLLLAVFLLSPPGLLKVADAERQLPNWLASAYNQMYEAEQPVMTLGAQTRSQSPAASPDSALPNPDLVISRKVLRPWLAIHSTQPSLGLLASITSIRRTRRSARSCCRCVVHWLA